MLKLDKQEEAEHFSTIAEGGFTEMVPVTEMLQKLVEHPAEEMQAS